jgi:hypothetical protein
MANRGCIRSKISDQSRQPGLEVVASTLLELVQEVGRPVGEIDLKTVAKDAFWRLRLEGLEEPVSTLVR